MCMCVNVYIYVCIFLISLVGFLGLDCVADSDGANAILGPFI